MNRPISQMAILFLSCLFSQPKDYLDLGVVINHLPHTQHSKENNISYMLSSDNNYIIDNELSQTIFKLPIKQTYKEYVNSNPNQSITKIQNISLLYLSENYMSTIEYIEQSINLSILDELHILFIADVLYRIGKYDRSLKVLNNLPLDMINDEYWMLKGLLHEELGDKDNQQVAFATLISSFPESDYFTIAKLKHKMLSR